jgi:hypothetical protein
MGCVRRHLDQAASTPIRGDGEAEEASRSPESSPNVDTPSLRWQIATVLPGRRKDEVPRSSVVGDALATTGEALDSQSRRRLEWGFNRDLTDVRVYTGAAAAESARRAGARAYTVGSNVVFGSGRYRPDDTEGWRLLSHEIAHVVQQRGNHLSGGRVPLSRASESSERAARGAADAMVRGEPAPAPDSVDGLVLARDELTTKDVKEPVLARESNKDDWSTLESIYGGDPRFVFWAKRHGKPPANAGEIAALYDEYKKAMKLNPKGMLEEYDRAQLEEDRSELEKRRQAARAAEDRAAESKPELRRRQRERAWQQNRTQLYAAIQKAWQERSRYYSSESANQAVYDVAHRVPLQKSLGRQHWKSDQHRWVFIHHFYREHIRLHPESSADDTELLQYAVLAEENHLETSAQEAEAAELARYRKGVGKAARTDQIRKLAAARPMNPLEDFEPGIHDYAPYQGQPQSVDVDIVNGDFDAENLTITYSDGKELNIPLGASLLFPNQPLDPNKVLRIFTRRHKKSQRLIPFVIYENTLGADLDVLSEGDLALMGLPRFDPALTPTIMYFLSPDFKMRKVTVGALKVASLHAGGLGLRQLGVPLASSTLRTGGTLLTGTARLGTAAARHVSFAVSTYGYSGVAATYLGRTAFTYYRINAVQINTLGLMGTDIAINLGGGDTGPVSPGDQVSMVVADAQAVAKRAKNYWKLIEGEVQEVNHASKQAILRITNVGDIGEDAAKAEYDLGKKLALKRQPAGKQPIKPVADPAKVGAAPARDPIPTPDPLAKDYAAREKLARFTTPDEVASAVVEALADLKAIMDKTGLPKSYLKMTRFLKANVDKPGVKEILELLPDVMGGLRDPKLWGEVMAEAVRRAKIAGTDINAALVAMAAESGLTVQVIRAAKGEFLPASAFFERYASKPIAMIDEAARGGDPHGSMTHLVQDLVVNRALKAKNLTSGQFREMLGKAEGTFTLLAEQVAKGESRIIRIGDYVWRETYDYQGSGQMPSPENVWKKLNELLGLL